MRLSKLVRSQEWLSAVKADDIESKCVLLDREITSAQLAGDKSEVYGLTYYKFRSSVSIPEVAYATLEMLETITPPPGEDLSVLIARILWEDMSDAILALRWLNRVQDSDMNTNYDGILSYDNEWWEFIGLGVKLGAACQLGLGDTILKDILQRIYRYIYLGNLCQGSLLKSLRLVIQCGREQTDDRVSNATSVQAEHLLWWIWADAKRQERFTPATVYDAVNIIETLLLEVSGKEPKSN